MSSVIALGSCYLYTRRYKNVPCSLKTLVPARQYIPTSFSGSAAQCKDIRCRMRTPLRIAQCTKIAPDLRFRSIFRAGKFRRANGHISAGRKSNIKPSKPGFAFRTQEFRTSRFIRLRNAENYSRVHEQ